MLSTLLSKKKLSPVSSMGSGPEQIIINLISILRKSYYYSCYIIASGKYVVEGFDDARLDTLFLVMPISWKGTLQQYAGQLHRNHHNKKVVRIFDYVDEEVPMLKSMFENREKGYKNMEYDIS